VASGSTKTSRVWAWGPDDLIANVCAYLPHNLAEWKQSIGDALPYQATCPDLPLEQEGTPAVTPTP